MIFSAVSKSKGILEIYINYEFSKSFLIIEFKNNNHILMNSYEYLNKGLIEEWHQIII